MRPFVGMGRTSWMRPLNSAFASSSDMSPPSARSRSSALPARRWPVATGTARASTVMSAGAVATSVTLTTELTLPARSDRPRASSGEVLGHELEDVCHAQVHVAPAGGGGDVDQAAGVVRGDDRAAGLGDGVQLPLGEAAGDPRPLKAEGAAKAAAVGDVRDVDHLVAGKLEQPPGLGLEPQLPQGLAGVVISDPGAPSVGSSEFGAPGQKLEC